MYQLVMYLDPPGRPAPAHAHVVALDAAHLDTLRPQAARVLEHLLNDAANGAPLPAEPESAVEPARRGPSRKTKSRRR